MRPPNSLVPPRRRIGACAAAFALLAATSIPAYAALYKWTDANGRTVYSDTPPIDVKADRMTGPAPAANPNAVKDMANQEADFRKRQLQRADDARKADKARADDARRAEACTQMQGQLKALADANVRYYRFNDKGERVMMDDTARKHERERLETLARQQRCADS